MTDFRQGLRPCVILVEDDPEQRRALQLRLQGSGFEVRAFSRGEQAVSGMGTAEACCLVTNDPSVGMAGADIVRCFRATGWSIPAILLSTASVHSPDHCEIFFAILQKPFLAQTLVDLLNRLRPVC